MYLIDGNTRLHLVFRGTINFDKNIRMQDWQILPSQK